jgi:hypothetical protein
MIRTTARRALRDAAAGLVAPGAIYSRDAGVAGVILR